MTGSPALSSAADVSQAGEARSHCWAAWRRPRGRLAVCERGTQRLSNGPPVLVSYPPASVQRFRVRAMCGKICEARGVRRDTPRATH